jgi:hypothetical protein
MDVINYVNGKIQEKDLENLNKTKLAVADHLENGVPLVTNFEKKIRTYCNKYGLTRAEVIASILSDDVAASAFAKSASRQRTAEKAQLDYLRYRRGVRVTNLPSSGRRSMRLQDNEIVDGTVPRTVNSTKTFDAVSTNGHTIDYIYQKFTNGFGGAQDNQAMDAIRFLEAATDYVYTHNDRIRFVAILDGAYYQRHKNTFEGFCNDRILVETSDSYKIRGRKTVYVKSKNNSKVKVV